MKKLILFLASVLSLSACQIAAGPGDDEIYVVTTTAMIGDMVQNIAGDEVYVESLMGTGTDPHLYTPTASDMNTLADADMIFYNGLHLEGKMIEIFESFEEEGRAIYAVADGVDVADLIESDANYQANDPHIWFDLEIWSDASEYVEDALVAFDAENEDLYRSNGELYRANLAELNEWAQDQINLIPEESRVLITAHDAFEYFGRAYGMEVMGVQGISTDSDYGLQDLERLIDTVIERNVSAIFIESSVSPKSIEALKAGVEAEGADLEIGGELFSDAMGAEGTEEGTHFGMVRHNVNTIVNALK